MSEPNEASRSLDKLAEQLRPLLGMTREQEHLLVAVARVLRGQLIDIPHPRRSDRSDLEALNRALAPFDPPPAQRVM